MSKKNTKFISVDETSSDILLDGMIDPKKIKSKAIKVDVTNSIRDNNDTEFKNIANSDKSNSNMNSIKEDDESSQT